MFQVLLTRQAAANADIACRFVVLVAPTLLLLLLLLFDDAAAAASAACCLSVLSLTVVSTRHTYIKQKGRI